MQIIPLSIPWLDMAWMDAPNNRLEAYRRGNTKGRFDHEIGYLSHL